MKGYVTNVTTTTGRKVLITSAKTEKRALNFTLTISLRKPDYNTVLKMIHKMASCK